MGECLFIGSLTDLRIIAFDRLKFFEPFPYSLPHYWQSKIYSLQVGQVSRTHVFDYLSGADGKTTGLNKKNLVNLYYIRIVFKKK